MGKYGSDEQVKFFYKHKFLGACDPYSIYCDAFYDLMLSDNAVATDVLDYMNSLGDPVFPVSEEDWDTPETDINKVDIAELYNIFMQELDYQYRDHHEVYVDEISDVEIFDGPVAEENVLSSTKIKASRYEGVPGYNPPKGGYLYIFKHGIGPGTLPSDVEIIKTKDLPNYYTAVWLSDFLTTDELKKYDIPDETRINELLGRIGYCQKNGDVVPCDEVEACGDIKASTRYMANMVSASDDGYEQLAEDEDDYYKYYVVGYFDNQQRGVDDNLQTRYFSDALDFAHDLACNGDFITIKNLITGDFVTYTPDEWMEAIDLGDVPSSVYTIR